MLDKERQRQRDGNAAQHRPFDRDAEGGQHEDGQRWEHADRQKPKLRRKDAAKIRNLSRSGIAMPQHGVKERRRQGRKKGRAEHPADIVVDVRPGQLRDEQRAGRYGRAAVAHENAGENRTADEAAIVAQMTPIVAAEPSAVPVSVEIAPHRRKVISR